MIYQAVMAATLGGARLHSTINNESTEYLMNPQELASLLGVSQTYTYRLLTTGQIPCARIGRLRKVRRSDVDAFVNARLEKIGG
jgi:excisionase family DNA binding protein